MDQNIPHTFEAIETSIRIRVLISASHNCYRYSHMFVHTQELDFIDSVRDTTKQQNLQKVNNFRDHW